MFRSVSVLVRFTRATKATRQCMQTLEGWLVTGELHQLAVCEEFHTYEECSWYLAAHKIPEDTGWIPEPLALVPDEEWL